MTFVTVLLIVINVSYWLEKNTTCNSAFFLATCLSSAFTPVDLQAVYLVLIMIRLINYYFTF